MAKIAFLTVDSAGRQPTILKNFNYTDRKMLVRAITMPKGFIQLLLYRKLLRVKVSEFSKKLLSPTFEKISKSKPLRAIL